MRRIALIIAVLLVAGTLAGCNSGGGGGAVGAPQVDWELTVSGAVGKTLTLSYADLTKMPQTELKDIMMQRSAGEPEETSWSGVALAEIFQRAQASSAFRSITAVAADGYAIEISKDEVEGSIVALKDQQDWIAKSDPDSGPIRIVCPNTPANRWVFQLKEIQVNE